MIQIQVDIVDGIVSANVINNNISSSIVDNTIEVNFLTGQPGNNGWTPVFSVVADGSTREVLRVIDWVGGGGTKPMTGQYVGASGFVMVIGDAVNIKGSGTDTNITDQLNSLETALNDTDADSKGVPLYGWYILQEGTDIGFKGQLQKRLT